MSIPFSQKNTRNFRQDHTRQDHARQDQFRKDQFQHEKQVKQQQVQQTLASDPLSLEHDQMYANSTVLCGVQSLMALLNTAHQRVIKILYHGALQGNRALVIEKAQSLNIACENVRLKQIEHFLPDLQHQGLMAFIEPAELVDWEDLCQIDPLDAHPKLLVALDQVTDPRNFGAILRSAEALGIKGALITRNRCAKPGPVVARTSAGASEIIPIAMETNLATSLEYAKSKGFQVVGADMGGKNLSQIQWQKPTVIVIGAEGYGMREKTIETCDEIVSIPHYGITESLNASVAASILFYEANRWRSLT
jgi:23S rRNA (guanosine2251-2'-O)-methyltransferase